MALQNPVEHRGAQMHVVDQLATPDLPMLEQVSLDFPNMCLQAGVYCVSQSVVVRYQLDDFTFSKHLVQFRTNTTFKNSTFCTQTVQNRHRRHETRVASHIIPRPVFPDSAPTPLHFSRSRT